MTHGPSVFPGLPAGLEKCVPGFSLLSDCGLMEKGVLEPLNHTTGQAGLCPVSLVLMSLSQAT